MAVPYSQSVGITMRAAIACALGLLLGQFACIVMLGVSLISFAEGQATMVDSCVIMRGQEIEPMRRQLDELQRWRVQVTLASRMGWSQAVRFIREHPLVYGEETR